MHQREQRFWHREHLFWRSAKSVHVRAESAFTLLQNDCSRSCRIGVHVAPEYAPIFLKRCLLLFKCNKVLILYLSNILILLYLYNNMFI